MCSLQILSFVEKVGNTPSEAGRSGSESSVRRCRTQQPPGRPLPCLSLRAREAGLEGVLVLRVGGLRLSTRPKDPVIVLTARFKDFI